MSYSQMLTGETPSPLSLIGVGVGGGEEEGERYYYVQQLVGI